MRERAEENRAHKLEQLESGSVVIRQMTDEERRPYPPQRKGRDGGEHARA